MEKQTVGVGQIIFTEKILTRAIFLLAAAANHARRKPIFHWLHEMAACCSFGVDPGKGHDDYSLSRLTDGTPHSSSDLLYFTHLIPFTWTNCSKSNSFSPFCFFGQNFLSPIPLPSSLRTKLCLVQLQFHKNILRQFQFLS